MNITLCRYYSDANCTLGIFTVEGREDPIWHTIEKPWLDNKPFVSCIPPGNYTIQPFHSPSLILYPDVWELIGPHNRDKILIHVANRADQLKGCIAPGLSAGYMKDEEGKLRKAVHSSRNAMNEIKKILGYPRMHELKIIG